MTAGRLPEDVIQAANWVRERLGEIPARGIVLGSGLGVLVDGMNPAREVATEEIPGFPPSTVHGHAGKLVAGELDGVPVLALKGRVHAYEGYNQQQVVFPVRLMAALGVSHLLLTNAVGSINRLYHPGDLVLVEDQINLMFRNPLRGPNDPEMGPRFPDMSNAVCPAMASLVRRVAQQEAIPLRVGVMGGVSGPSYETPAEIRMLARIGADIVGMSTIPELIAAKHIGLNAVAISCVTNYAAGISASQLDHSEVTEVAERARGVFRKLVVEVLRGC